MDSIPVSRTVVITAKMMDYWHLEEGVYTYHVLGISSWYLVRPRDAIGSGVGHRD